MRFEDKTALITGGNSGIGLEVARLLVDQGCKVAITGRDADKLEKAVVELGPNCIPILVDFSKPNAVSAMIENVENHLGHLDIVFANAGGTGATPLGTTTATAFDQILQTNVTAVFLTVQAAAPLMSEGGSIILNGSITRAIGRPGSAAYAGSKAAVTAMAKVFASELIDRGIRVNTVVPGGTRTPIWTRGRDVVEGVLDAAESAMAPFIPMQRLATPTEVANAVVFLASDDSSGMTAAELVVDGGTTGAPWGARVFRKG